VRGQRTGKLERHRTRVASSLLPGARSRVIDEDAAHRDAGHSQQALAIHDLHVMLSQQPQVGFSTSAVGDSVWSGDSRLSCRRATCRSSW
jgi:hypothetical protein